MAMMQTLSHRRSIRGRATIVMRVQESTQDVASCASSALSGTGHTIQSDGYPPEYTQQMSRIYCQSFVPIIDFPLCMASDPQELSSTILDILLDNWRLANFMGRLHRKRRNEILPVLQEEYDWNHQEWDSSRATKSQELVLTKSERVL
ncbi:hypothetical protein FRC12_004880 [Ceratobasidium sp. 428]|nr:hypothetical protein FRC12_004880 [Ceratobasidium sp. 428]